jgi:hypothetical protein
MSQRYNESLLNRRKQASVRYKKVAEHDPHLEGWMAGVETRFLRRHQIVLLGAIGRRGMGPNKGRHRMARQKISLALATSCVSRVLLFAWTQMVAVRISFFY